MYFFPNVTQFQYFSNKSFIYFRSSVDMMEDWDGKGIWEGCSIWWEIIYGLKALNQFIIYTFKRPFPGI